MNVYAAELSAIIKGNHICEKLIPVVACEFSVFYTFYTIFKIP